ncbi:MAG: PKD repeat protein [Psychroserpens sp.]|jgi:PKD repeat protein
MKNKSNIIFLLRNKRLAGLFILLSSFVLNSSSAITSIEVAGVFLNPTATISISSENICIGEQATITLEGSDGVAPYTFKYKINDTVQDEITTTGSSFTFSTEIVTAGSYTYSVVEIKDANGVTETYINQQKMVEVTATDPPVVSFNFDNDGACSGETVQFTSNVVGSGTYEYSWDFGDGNTSILENPTHIYNATGTGTETFFVLLSVSDGDNCTSSATNEITVQEKPVLLFLDDENPARQFRNCGVSPDPDDPNADDFTISVRNASSNTSTIDADSYTIDWGDGTTIQQVVFPATHTYTSIGAYDMVISATGTNGCVAQVTYLVLNSSNPAAGFGTVGGTQNVCIGSELGFKISNFSENNATTTYEINWGDGGEIEVYTQEDLSTYIEENPEKTDFEVTHIYNSGSCALENGSYTATLSAGNSCPNPTIISIQGITVLAKPISDFVIETVLPGCPDVPVEFTNTSFVGDSDGCSKFTVFTWDFGDGSDEVTVVAFQANPNDSQSHAYTEPGTYNVELTAEGQCGTVSVTKQVTIEPAVVASFDIDSDGEDCIPFVIKATNTIDESIFNEPLTYNWTVSYLEDNCGTSGDWIFLNGTSASSENPEFQFNSPGRYTITQSIPSYCNTATADKTVIVKQPPEVAIDPIGDFCQPGVIKPTAIIGNCTPDQDEVTYSWTFVGGTPSVSTLETPEEIAYLTPGIYTVTLAVTNECGTFTDTQEFEVLEKPILTNAPSTQEICSNQSTTAISLTSNNADSTFRWTATADTNISGFIPSGTTQVIPSQILLNSGTTQGTVEYVAFPILNGCEGDPITFTVLVNATPIITTQPVSSAVCIDGTATLLEVVTQNGIGTPTYQWFSNDSNSMVGGDPIAGATNSTFTAPTEAASEVFYYVVISFEGGCEDLASYIVSVNTLEQPTAVAINETQTFCAGGDAFEFSFDLFGGVGTPTYQWYSNTTDSNTGGTLLTGATNSTYIPADATFVNTGIFYYYVIVTLEGTGCSDAISNTFEVIVVLDPVIDGQPIITQEICQNTEAQALEVDASGDSDTGTFSYQWYSNTTNTNTGGTLVSTNYPFIPPTDTVGTRYYYVVVSQIASGCNVVSATSEIKVTATPTITTQPVSSAVCIDGTATLLEVAAQDGVGTPTYQWFSNDSNSLVGGVLIDGATNSSYMPVTDTISEVFYYVVISFEGGCADLISNIVVVNTLVQPTANTVNTSQTICEAGDASEFIISLTGGAGTPSYQWYSNSTDSNAGGVEIVGATSSTYIAVSDPFINTGNFYYYVIVNFAGGTGCSTATSDPFEVIVVLDPVIDSQPIVAQELCENIQAQALEVIPSGADNTGAFSYQWYSNTTNTNTGGTPVNTSSAYTPPTGTVGTLYYYVVVSQTASGCEVVSNTAEIKVNPTPTIITQPVSSAVCTDGVAVLLEVETQNGVGTPAYQWFSNDSSSMIGSVSIVGATNSTFTAPTDTAREVYYYVVISFTGGCADLTSNIVSVNTLEQPIAVAINETQTFCAGGDAFEFTFDLIGGVGTPTYQWYSNSTDSNTGGLEITGATSNTYTAVSDPFINTGVFYYYVIVTLNGPGCSDAISDTFEIIVVPDPVINSQPIVAQEICQNIEARALEVNHSGDSNSGTFSYQWYSNTTNTNTGGTPVSSNQPYIPPTDTVGTLYYYVVVSQTASGCEVVSATAEIKVNATPTIITQPDSSAVCIDGVATLLEVETQDGVGAPTYQWFSNETNSVAGGILIAGATNNSYMPPTDTASEVFYYVVTSFEGGCADLISDIAFVNTLEQAIAVTVNTSQTICEGGVASEFNINLTGGAGTPNYQWYSNTIDSNTGGVLIVGATSRSYVAAPDTFSNTGGFYYYVIVNFPFRTGCSTAFSDTFEVIVVPDPVIDSQPIVAQELCENIQAQALEVDVSGNNNTGTYSYQWYSNATNTNTGGTPVSTSSSYTPPTGSVGTLYYYVVVSQTASGCEVVSDTAEIKVNLTPNITTQPDSSDICIGEAATLLEVVTQNGVGTPTYHWFSNETNSMIGSVSIAGETNNTYSAPIDTIGEVFYYVVISFQGGCADLISNIVYVKINEVPVIDFGEVTIYSEETFIFDPATIITNGVPDGTTYTWTTPTSSIPDAIVGASEETSSQPNISQTLINLEDIPVIETYIITPATPSCIGEPFILEVTVNPSIKSNIVITDNSCFESNDGTITTNIVGGIPFETLEPYLISWTGPNGFTSNEAKIINLIIGDYILTIEDKNGETITESHTIRQPDLLTITTDLEKNISCFEGSDGAIEVTVTGGTLPYVFNWTAADGSGLVLNAEGQTTLTVGTYVLEIIDANNCVRTESFTLTQPDIIVIETALKVDILCFGGSNGSIDVNVSGGSPLEVTPGNFQYSYNWTGPNGFVSASENLINLFVGTYTLEITDNLGCIETADFNIDQPTALELSFTKTDATCYEAADGSIEVTATGGKAPYQITWSNIGSGFTKSNLTAGTYIATVIDDHNCETEISITIEHPIFYIESNVTPISCNGEIDGAITLNIVGGIAPLSITWSDDPSVGLNRTNVGPGTYSVIIADSGENDCPIEQTFIFTNPAAIAVSSVVVDAVDCAKANSGSINLEVSGGTAPYAFVWNSGQITEDINDIPAGDYSVQIEDINGCLAVREFTIFRQEPSNISFTETAVVDCNLNTIQIRNIPTVTGGFFPYTFSWSDGTISGLENEIMTTDQSGSYTLTITDGQGCVETVSIQVDVPITGTPDFSFSSFSISEYGIISIKDPIQFTDLSTGNYEIVSWAFGDGSPIVDTIDPIHIYEQVGTFTITLTVVYVSGCVYETTRTISTIRGYSLVLPNAFTPNGDAINDVIRPSYRGFDDIEMSIYDTWGTLVYFEKGLILEGWKGDIRGNPAENGNYIMYVKGITFYGQEVKESSTITLLK